MVRFDPEFVIKVRSIGSLEGEKNDLRTNLSYRVHLGIYVCVCVRIVHSVCVCGWVMTMNLGLPNSVCRSLSVPPTPQIVNGPITWEFLHAVHRAKIVLQGTVAVDSHT